MPTSVILVCVHDLQESINITHELLYSLFSAYGNVLRILIFERTNTFKSFVEYDNPQSALNARKNLNRLLLFEGLCRMSIYPSNLQVIKFQNNFPGGVDYTLQQQQQQRPQQPFIYNNAFDNLQQVSSPGIQVNSPFRQRAQYVDTNQYGSSKSSSSGAHSPSNSRSISEEDAVIDDEIMQMVNKHHSETNFCDDDDDKCLNNVLEEKENDEFSKALENVFHVDTNIYRRESFNSATMYPGSFGGYEMNQNNYARRPFRTTTFPLHHNDYSAAFDSNCFGNMSVLSAFSGPSVSKLRSMEDIRFEAEAQDERVSQPGLNHRRNGSYEKNFSTYQTRSENTSNFSNGSILAKEEEEEKKSPVLHVLGIENKEVSARMLFNIFSNFGKIIKLIFIKTRAVALVEFEEIASAALAKDSLHNISFMGKPLRITFSKYPTIRLKPGQDEKYPDQLIVGEDNGEQKPFGTSPSTTLLVSNVSKNLTHDKKTISNLFGAYGEVKSVKMSEGNFLVKMRSVEESLKAMAHLNDTELCGNKIHVCFSRSTF